MLDSILGYSESGFRDFDQSLHSNTRIVPPLYQDRDIPEILSNSSFMNKLRNTRRSNTASLEPILQPQPPYPYPVLRSTIRHFLPFTDTTIKNLHLHVGNSTVGSFLGECPCTALSGSPWGLQASHKLHPVRPIGI
jgi:hypothetical protein